MSEGTSKDAAATILVVEDERILGEIIATILQDEGFRVGGPAGSVAEAMSLVSSAACDAALLDAYVGGVDIEPVARALEARGIPFAFMSGFGRVRPPAAYLNARLISKPFTAEEIVAAVREMLVDRTNPAELNKL